MIGGNLTDEGLKVICEVLKANLNVFTWKQTDITRVPKTLAEHKLGVKGGTLLVRQKKRGQASKRSKGYHQIQIAEEDEEKTAFHTSRGRNLEVYVDDLVIKSHSEQEAVRDIEETFYTLRRINMKLNPKKCTFGAAKGMSIEHAISKDGIQACSEKAQAIINMPSPRTLKEVQSLNEKLTSLNRFLSKAAIKSLPFFKTLKHCIKKSDFAWTEEAEKALKDMKTQMAELPTLTAHIQGETLIMYLSVAEEAISTILLPERGNKQILVYFMGRAMQPPEINCPFIEKLVLSLVHAARLRRYFQAHPVAVITDQPIKQAFLRTQNSGRLAKWAIELGEINQVEKAATIANEATSKHLADIWRKYTCLGLNLGRTKQDYNSTQNLISRGHTKCGDGVTKPGDDCEIDRTAGGKLYDKNAKESWEIIENLALYNHEGWNDPRDFDKPVKTISLPQDTLKMPNRRLLELED
ncbi:reverse transcriptase domain-containing protein [Tanacetum coccineum]